RRSNVPIGVTLQGDDILLRGMPQRQQAQALAQIARLSESIDGFIANSEFYAREMADYLGVERGKIAVVPLGIDTRDFENSERARGRAGEGEIVARPSTIGYLARLAPEKGLHILAEAFIRLRAMPEMAGARLRVAGWLGDKDRTYV